MMDPEELLGCISCTCILSSGTTDTRRLHDNNSIICALYIYHISVLWRFVLDMDLK